MAKRRENYYLVPMSLAQAQAHLDKVSALGMQLMLTPQEDEGFSYQVRRLSPTGRTLDESRGQIQRWDDDTSRVDPQDAEVKVWKLVGFYLFCLLLGLVLALLIATAIDGLRSRWILRIMLAVLVVYGGLFWLLQPQRLIFRTRDSRLDDFVKAILSGPYADPAHLYEHYFPGQPYWQRHYAELKDRDQREP